MCLYVVCMFVYSLFSFSCCCFFCLRLLLFCLRFVFLFIVSNFSYFPYGDVNTFLFFLLILNTLFSLSFYICTKTIFYFIKTLSRFYFYKSGTNTSLSLLKGETIFRQKNIEQQFHFTVLFFKKKKEKKSYFIPYVSLLEVGSVIVTRYSKKRLISCRQLEMKGLMTMGSI